VTVQERLLVRSVAAVQLGLAFLLSGVVLEAALTVALGMGTAGRAPRRPGAVGAVVRELHDAYRRTALSRPPQGERREVVP
jgi:hypothetical protein